MSEPNEDDAFERLKQALASCDPAERSRGLEDLIRSYSPRIQSYAHRAFFAQLRPTVTTQDAASRVCQKLASHVEKGKVELRSEREFLGLIRIMTDRTLSDLARRARPATTSLDEERPDGGRIDVASADATASVQAREEERLELIRAVSARLRQILQPDEAYLIRRHFLEGATYAELAAELSPAADGQPKSADAIRMRLKRLREELIARGGLDAFRHLMDSEG